MIEDQMACGQQSEDRPNNLIKRLRNAHLLSSEQRSFFRKATLLPNGGNLEITLGKVWQQYKTEHLPTVSESSRTLKEARGERFLAPAFNVKMCDLNPQVIGEFLRFSKETHVQKRFSKRWNFEKEIKDFKSMLNWYRDIVDFQFANPIRPLHLKIGVIEEIPEKNRRISIEQVQKFLKALDPRIQDLAMIQFFYGARIGEIAGLQAKNIDLENRILTIKEVMVWINGKPKIKSCPKNGQSREVFINDTMLEIFKKRLQELPEGCPFVFHKKGEPFRYNYLDSKYNQAWRRAGLKEFSGTHLLRYAAAQSSRRITGSLDGAKAVTGHVSLALAQKYSDYGNIEQNRASVQKLEEALLNQNK